MKDEKFSLSLKFTARQKSVTVRENHAHRLNRLKKIITLRCRFKTGTARKCLISDLKKKTNNQTKQ